MIEYQSFVMLLTVYCITVVAWFRLGKTSLQKKWRIIGLQFLFFVALASLGYLISTFQRDNPLAVVWMIVISTIILGVALFVFWLVILFDIFTQPNSQEK